MQDDSIFLKACYTIQKLALLLLLDQSVSQCELQPLNLNFYTFN